MLYLELFYTFFIIGLFGFGGGYGMLSLIQTKVVPVWMTTSQFTDIVAISQMTPGPIGINSATYCGYMACHNAGMGEMASVFGSAVATFALVLPSLILMIIISKLFMKYMKTKTVQSVFTGLRPAVVGLLAAATLLLCNRENFSTSSENPWQFWISVFLFCATYIGTKVYKINPIKMILMAAIAGLLLFYPSTASAQRGPRPRRMAFVTDTVMVHDPVMAYEKQQGGRGSSGSDGTYYLLSTGNGLQWATSRDRRSWVVQPTPFIEDLPQWTRDSVPGFNGHVWAPDIIRYHDRWLLGYSCSTFGKNTSAIGLMSADRLDGKWKDEGCLVCSKEGRDDWNAIDPAFIVDDNDQLWLAWGSFWDGIQIGKAPLSSPEGDTIVPADKSIEAFSGVVRESTTIARRHRPGDPNAAENPTSKYAGRNAIEAPFILKHGGWYYLFVSWDYCCRGALSNYRVAVGRSKTVDGPYIDRDGKPMTEGGGTLFLEGDKQEFEAAGHCAAYDLPSGETIFICHGYSTKHNGASILIQKTINWSSDGWPSL